MTELPDLSRLTHEEKDALIRALWAQVQALTAQVQTLVARSLAAKGTLDGALRTALSAMNLPSTADVEQLRGKVDDLERLLSSVESKVDTLVAARKK